MGIPRQGILAGGNWIIDYVKTIDVYPEPDCLANILDETAGNGGSPYNVLLDLAKLGVDFPLEAVGLVGDDAAGRSIFDDCRSHGIDTTLLAMTALAPTSYTDVMTERKTGRRTFFHQRGANALLDGEHFTFTRTHAKIFHLGYLLLLDRLDAAQPNGSTAGAQVLRQAGEAGLITSVDAVSEDSDRFREVVLPALPYCDFCFLNEFEAARTTGIPLRNEGVLQWDALAGASRFILDRGVRGWVVIHFPEGAYAMGAEGASISLGSVRLPQERIAGTVGAGDAFAAGVLYGFHEGLEMKESMRIGACAAAACLTGRSTSDGIKPLPDCLALGEQYGYRETPANL